jgi:hypothetical protein
LAAELQHHWPRGIESRRAYDCCPKRHREEVYPSLPAVYGPSGPFVQNGHQLGICAAVVGLHAFSPGFMAPSKSGSFNTTGEIASGFFHPEKPAVAP